MNLIIDPFWRWWNFSLLDLLRGVGRRAVALLDEYVSLGKVMAVLLLVFLFVVLHAVSNWEREGMPSWLRKFLEKIGPMTGTRVKYGMIGAVVLGGLLVLRPLVLSVGLIMVGVTIWTYRGVAGASAGRLVLLIGVRLLAGLSALLLVVQPAFTAAGSPSPSGTLLLLLDASASMTITDEVPKQSRWTRLRRVLDDAQPLFQKLQHEYNVTVVPYQFAEDVRPFASTSKPDGARTDFGQALQALYQFHGQEEQLWGLLIFSDGVDNGNRYQPLLEAARWRGLSCPIHTFGLGTTSTTDPQPLRLTEGELDRQAADHEFLARLAQAGGGQFHLVQDLPRCLEDLQNTPRPRPKPAGDVWPDWRERTWSGFRVSYLGLLMGLLCLEWFCRRSWGLA